VSDSHIGSGDATAIALEAMVFAYPMLFNYKTVWEQTQDQFSRGLPPVRLTSDL
jgi:hypothetical protein